MLARKSLTLDPSGYLPFTAARAFVRGLKFNTGAEFLGWAAGHDEKRTPRPDTIPANPHQVYVYEWVSMSDFLGNERVAFYNREFLDFRTARDFALGLGFNSSSQWRAYIRGDFPELPQRPINVPTNPNFTYAGQGWQSWGDWLGYAGVSQKRVYRPFEEARTFAHGLKLKRWLDWREYVAGRLKDLPPKPADIPAIPHATYRGAGWLNYGDWLGTGVVANHQREWMSYRDSHEFVSKLGLKNALEWRDYCAGRIPGLPPRPANIPANPDKIYHPRDWKGYKRWLKNDARNSSSGEE